MYRLKVLIISIILLTLLSVAGSSFDVSARPLAATAPTLGAADSFAILAGTPNITNIPTSVITGDVGLSPATGAAIGLTCLEVTGTIYAVDAAGPACFQNNPGLLTNAKADLATAYNALSAGPNAACTQNFGAVTQELAGLSLVPGVYCADAFELSGTLFLEGEGIWIFRSASTLVTSGTANVVGGNACSVWWRVPSSATLGANTQLTGNILALTSITMASFATLDGRALARNGAVTLDQNTINIHPGCVPGPNSGGTGGATDEEDSGRNKGIGGLPNTGGAPIRHEGFPWSLAIVGGLGVIVLIFGVRFYRRTL